METVRYYDPVKCGSRSALLVKRGRKLIKLILIQFPVKLKTIRAEREAGRIKPMEDYDPAKTLKIVRKMIRAQYGTIYTAPKGLRAALRECKKGEK